MHWYLRERPSSCSSCSCHRRFWSPWVSMFSCPHAFTWSDHQSIFVWQPQCCLQCTLCCTCPPDSTVNSAHSDFTHSKDLWKLKSYLFYMSTLCILWCYLMHVIIAPGVRMWWWDSAEEILLQLLVGRYLLHLKSVYGIVILHSKCRYILHCRFENV